MDHPGKLKQNQASISYVFPPWSRRKRSPNSLWVWRSGSQVGSARGSLACVCRGNVPPEHHPGRASQWNHQSRSGPAGRSKTIGLTLGGSNLHNLGARLPSSTESRIFIIFSEEMRKCCIQKNMKQGFLQNNVPKMLVVFPFLWLLFWGHAVGSAPAAFISDARWHCNCRFRLGLLQVAHPKYWVLFFHLTGYSVAT